MALLDVLGRRWTLRILWELRHSRLPSRALRAAADHISPTVLQTRINELRDAGFVDLDSAGYGLTSSGRELLEAFGPLYRFSNTWATKRIPND